MLEFNRLHLPPNILLVFQNLGIDLDVAKQSPKLLLVVQNLGANYEIPTNTA